MPTRAGLRIAAIVAAGLVYVIGSYWLTADPNPGPWNAVGVLAPMLAAVALGAWRGGQRVLGGVAALALIGLCVPAALGVPVSAQLMYLAQHIGVHLFLAFGFGSTLRAGRTPLISLLASRVHRVFPPAMAIYTRKVTLAWTIYFVAMALVSALLFAFARFEVWAVFANLLTPISIALMFGAEFTLRYRLHPEFERSSVADAIRSYRGGTRAEAAPGDSVA